MTVLAMAGDGGTADIGIQALSGAAERNEDFIYVCYDNEAYMNTGIQRSSSTPYGAWTTTTPGKDWKKMRKKNIVEALVAHRIPYAATASISHPEDLIGKVQKAKSMKGSRFLHIFASCPTGWKIPSEMAVKIARMAVQTNIFPLYEVEDGLHYTINLKPKRFPVREYFKIQGRFQHLKDEDLEVRVGGSPVSPFSLIRKRFQPSEAGPASAPLPVQASPQKKWQLVSARKSRQ